jgi:hypothetical protein
MVFGSLFQFLPRMFIEAMAMHEVLTKNFFESNLKKKKLPSQIHKIMGQNAMNDS